MRLQKAQKEAVIAWVAEGLETDEINKRAAKFKPRFKVSKTQVAFYRTSRKATLKEIQHAGEFNALNSGLALKEQRVQKLQDLATLLITDLLPANPQDSKLWITFKKSVGMTVQDVKEFNKAEVDTLRGVFDDIASEVGERQPGVQVNNTYNFNMDDWKKQRSKRLQDIAGLEE